MTYRPYSTLTISPVTYVRTNNTGVTVNKGTPVRMNTSGDIDFVDVSNESQILSIAAIAAESIANGQDGEFVTSGRVADIATTANFGDVVYVSKAGGLTATKPNTGVDGFVSGDFVVMVGVIAKNELNPSLKDLIIHLDIIGQL